MDAAEKATIFTRIILWHLFMQCISQLNKWFLFSINGQMSGQECYTLLIQNKIGGIGNVKTW